MLRLVNITDYETEVRSCLVRWIEVLVEEDIQLLGLVFQREWWERI